MSRGVVEWLFHAVPRGCLRYMIVVFPDHTHLLFFYLVLHTNLSDYFVRVFINATYAEIG